MSENGQDNAGTLPVTRWSLVARAGGEPGETKCRALGELLSLYMPVLRAHVQSRMKLPPEVCDDLLQEFVTQKILERDILANADRGIGRFRTYLLTCLDRFILNQIRNENAYKRNRKALAGHLREMDSACEHITPGTFDVAWARQVIAQALDLAYHECCASGHRILWTIFDCRVLGPLFRDERPMAYEVLAQQLWLASAKEASNLLITAKRIYARTLRRVVSQYCGDSDVDGEIVELKEILSRARA